MGGVRVRKNVALNFRVNFVIWLVKHLLKRAVGKKVGNKKRKYSAVLFGNHCVLQNYAMFYVKPYTATLRVVVVQ